MPIPILAQTDQWVAVAKPCKMPVHRSRMVNERRTVVRVLNRQLGRKADPVHRLDRATSGVLLFSFDPAWTAKVQAAWPSATKRYLAIVRGHIETRDSILVNKPIKMETGDHKEAETLVHCIGSSKEPRCSLLLAEPKTGRYHQVRRHVRDIGHPVIGDSTHGDTRFNRAFRQEHGLNRLALHCWSISVEVDGEQIDLRCGLPADFANIAKKMPWWDEAVERYPTLEEHWSPA